MVLQLHTSLSLGQFQENLICGHFLLIKGPFGRWLTSIEHKMIIV